MLGLLLPTILIRKNPERDLMLITPDGVGGYINNMENNPEGVEYIWICWKTP